VETLGLDGYKVEYIATDLLAMAKLVLEREKSRK
jgi:hypothetical protein